MDILKSMTKGKKKTVKGLRRIYGFKTYTRYYRKISILHWTRASQVWLFQKVKISKKV